jgi:hypothetical protein
MEAFGLKNLSVTATGAAQDVGGINKARQYLFIQNLHDTQTVYVRFSMDNETEVTDAVVGAAGCIELAPGAAITFEGRTCPSGELSVIATGGSNPVTILEG